MNSSLASLSVEEIARRLRANARRLRTTETDAGGENLKCAAVLVPLLWERGEWHLLFTRRTEYVESHKGQVSFPGGACDAGESQPEETALRESEEEIGLKRSQVHLLGRLPPMITITHFRVTPVVGVIAWPIALKVSTQEVARVFTIPLAWLDDPSNRWEFIREDRQTPLIAYHPYDGELLWGATARMTLMLLEALGSRSQKEGD
uniref:MutT/nudix family protein n=1 Tax=uncultured Chloroflexota bacterium TaxID=166587 RepID=H5SL38_9CHLR|nr:MutT/nudix family protein [uncultured Chloroflexota bacterium]